MKRSLILAFTLTLIGVLPAQEVRTDIWSLEKCIQHALDNNLQVHQTQLAVSQNEAGLKQAQASRYPNLSGGANAGLNLGRSVDPFTNDFVAQTIRTSNFSLNTSVPLFSGFQINNSIQQSQIDLRASKKDLEQGENDVILAVAQAYLNVLFNAEILSSAETQVSTTRGQRDRTKKLVNAGSLPVASLLEIESQIATEDLNVVNAQNQLELSYLILQQTLNLDLNERFGIERPEIPDPSSLPPPISAEDVYKTAEGTLPGIQAADLRIQSAGKGIEIAKGGRYPTLFFSANAFTGYSSLRQRAAGAPVTTVVEQEIFIDGTPVTVGFPNNSFNFEKIPYFDQLRENRNGQLSLGLNVPIYSRRQNITAIEQAQLGLKNAQLSAEIQRQTLKQTIEQAYLDVKTSYAAYTSTTRQIDALELSFKNTEKQFDVGVVNSVDYLVAKNNLNRAKFDLVRLKFDYLFKLKILEFYQGKPIGF
ncbi:MAG: TolC family protein [Bacteroidota bacterium]